MNWNALLHSVEAGLAFAGLLAVWGVLDYWKRRADFVRSLRD